MNKPYFSNSAFDLIKDFQDRTEAYETTQPNSDEALSMRAALDSVDNDAVEKAERVLQNDPSAFAWIFKNYICIKNRKGYKYPSVKFFA